MTELPFCQQVIELNINPFKKHQERGGEHCETFDLKEKNIILLCPTHFAYYLYVFAGTETYASVSRPLPV